MPIEQGLKEVERTREAYWLRYPQTSPVKLHWRAVAVRHCFHVLPGESILEIGAGGGLWTRHLSEVLRGECSITAAVFNDDLAEQLERQRIPSVSVARVRNLAADLPARSFDYIVGNAILCHEDYAQDLRALHQLLKPGGQILFFEANFWNPQVFVKSVLPWVGRWSGNARGQIGMRRHQLMRAASHQGFIHVDIVPFDIVHPRTPARLLPLLQPLAFVYEHAPILRELCGTLYIWAQKPGERIRPRVNLAEHRQLFDAVSVVVPCHNEAMNVSALVDTLIRFYDPYIHEIVIVNDNSDDDTAAVTRELAAREPRVKLVNRTAPNGVGRALRDGYAAATGRYILTMDADFVRIVPEFRDLFDVIAQGHDGAIGSRFSHESVLINYPFSKIVCNRGFHLLVRLLLFPQARDTSNNLKLYRAEILKDMTIEEAGFAANAETGLKAMLAGYDVCEVPVSWINRTAGMGSSTFKTLQVAPAYFCALVRILRAARRARKHSRQACRQRTETTRRRTKKRTGGRA
jgi:dolichol-phosphate mannosyltransferase